MEMDFTGKVIGCAIEVHKQLGPGLLESTYEKCLMYELYLNGITAQSQVILPICYKNIDIEAGYRLDILLPNKLVIELKSVDKIIPVYSAQLLTYMKLTDIDKGLLINFNVKKLADGVRRFNLSF
ncbi:GxxExxY protein [Colwellia polaris]|jgi:GxxExxY protein|uniref:GxxExxY protein n=1 Tax=Colwellia polaris TaxID=326537 RepID=UPI000A176896|nr:GxxExxY protein [Colwellia polaris]|tara:strand:- start:3757 stop:4131 length:375 start_codon:yes stop_codon:yes gene_type:complete